MVAREAERAHQRAAAPAAAMIHHGKGALASVLRPASLAGPGTGGGRGDLLADGDDDGDGAGVGVGEAPSVIVGVGDWSDYVWDHAYDVQGRWRNGNCNCRYRRQVPLLRGIGR